MVLTLHKISCKIISQLIEDGVCNLANVPSVDTIRDMLKELVINRGMENGKQNGPNREEGGKEQTSSLESKVAELEAKLGPSESKIGRLESNLVASESKVAKLECQLWKFENKVVQLESKLESNSKQITVCKALSREEQERGNENNKLKKVNVS